MQHALQHRGLHGIGLNELLTQAKVPKGVLYHHFPGGKVALAVAAIQGTCERLTLLLDRHIQAQSDPAQVLGRWLDAALAQLEQSGFERGCPLATVALESTRDDTALRQALADAFAILRSRIAALLEASSVPAQQAQGMAALLVAAYEGALMQARVAGHAGPMRDGINALMAWMQAQLPPLQRA